MKEMISIVVPVYNAQEFLEDTVQSVRAQTYPYWELLLVHDGSTDKSMEIMEKLAKKDGRIRIFDKENTGAADTRNFGVKKARGEYLAFLDADDLWLPEKLKKELCYMKEKDAAFVFTGYEFADETGKGTGKVVLVPEKLTYKQALKNTTIFTSTVLFDLKKIKKEELMMPQIKSEDTALWWRLLKNGYIAHGCNENLVLYRRAKKTLSSNKLEALRRIWVLYRKAEGLSIAQSSYNFCFWAVNAVLRRI